MLKDELILYHGSFCPVTSVDLEKCSNYKDFGKGFYLTTSKEQAINFARLTTKKAIQTKTILENSTKGFVSTFKLKNTKELKSYIFETANKDWLHCIVAHRKVDIFKQLIEQYKNYDVICGKIANDNTNATIVAYMTNTFGQVGTEHADDICISLLLPERLKDQFCFRTQKAINHLQFLESYEL